jgi:hypothetical protein
MGKLFHGCVFISIVALLWGCAQVRSISGGEKDTAPPRIVDVSPDSLSTRFSKNSFTITFDEFVQLRNVQQELIVSPPLKNTPRVQLRQRELVVAWDDTLAQNTTYTFQFGNAISDLNEGNALPDFTYIFSTGDVLDSLQCAGIVRDAKQDAAAKAMKVLLYDSLSQVFDKKQRPVYFGRTDDHGRFTLKYLRSGDFLLCALSDENGNYHYDPGESIAWLDNVKTTAGNDSTLHKLDLSVPRDSIWTIENYLMDSLAALRFHVEDWMHDIRIRTLDESKIAQWQVGDTIYASPLSTPTSEIQYEVDLNATKRDTVEAKFLLNESSSFKLTTTTKDRIRSVEAIEIRTGRFISAVDSTRITLLEDSVAIPHTLMKATPDRLNLTAGWRAGHRYVCSILPGLTSDFTGATNDTLLIDFSVYEGKELGALRMKLPACVEKTNTVLQVLNKSGEPVFTERNAKAGELIVAGLLPGEYSAIITEDKNGNGYFDPLVIAPFQPTEINHVYPGKISIRANWDVEIAWPEWQVTKQ